MGLGLYVWLCAAFFLVGFEQHLWVVLGYERGISDLAGEGGDSAERV